MGHQEEKDDRDFIILANPKEDLAAVCPTSANALKFMEQKYGSISVRELPSGEVNKFLKQLKELNFVFSFRVGP